MYTHVYIYTPILRSIYSNTQAHRSFKCMHMYVSFGVTICHFS